MALVTRITIFSAFFSVLYAQSVLFPYGEEVGDDLMVEGDEATTSSIILSEDLIIFGDHVYTFHVNTNGVISVNNAFVTFYPKFIPFTISPDEPSFFIAPFYADIDTSGGRGNIYYRYVGRADENDYLFKRVQRMVDAAFFDIRFINKTFEGEFMLIVTWDSVSYFSEEDKANHTNTFQAVLISDGEVESYAIFNYENISWTTGVSPNSKANPDGTGGTPGAMAKVGFNYGDGVKGFMLNVSGTDDVINMDETSNIGIPGRWIFRLDQAEIEAPSETIRTRCLPGWTFLEIEYACYKFYNEHRNWWEADRKCKREGGQLATVTTPEKNDFIAGSITGGVKTWVGATRNPMNETLWEWITDEPWYFHKWRKREPNNWGDAEDCLNTNFVRPGLWNDHFCQNRKAFICEMIPIADESRGGEETS
ncbi:Alpha-tectorin [Holothuria leucospilota]|uniref:Alpha-tectorin n=1 Tax=Holothuria leucospilota TaxID=206669 RepID=A0A9Q1CA02_HOLLE|nr:Alpha-tectorin [Holothuria leucospilota]